MKFLLIACLGSLVFAQQGPAGLQGPGPFVRDFRANVLREFPGLCFSAITFRLYLENQSWSLFPICGKAECINNGHMNVERVHDCGPQPRNPVLCTIANLAELRRNTILEYPSCCPKYVCPDGVTLEYPTKDEIKADILKRQAAALRAAKLAAATREAAVPQTAPAII
ncbi:uncharacterized protein [Penaeus vannamei]|uniref:uncharacterized protein n=1 Tax=Penaeus vannamei TaxID=6689 RepID=UPI00387F84F9